MQDLDKSYICFKKWHGIAVSMMAYSPEDPGSIPHHAKVM